MRAPKRKTPIFAAISSVAVHTITDPFTKFLHLQQASGYLLLLATFVSLFLANSSLGNGFVHFWHTELHIGALPFFSWTFTLEQLVNDGLMTVFFTVVGLEIKRELIEGALSSRAQAMLPIAGAIGGMIFPALIFLVFNHGTPSSSGWAIPTATDIAFSLAVIQLLGNKVPLSLKIFLTALAVVDDLGAIIVIALFYSHGFDLMYLLGAAGVVLLLFMLNQADVRNVFAYCFVGIFLWVFLHKSGIHATISGVIMALCVPFRFKNYNKVFQKHWIEIQRFTELLSERKKVKPEIRDQIIEEMQRTSTLMEAPLNNMLHLLHGFSSYLVMPLFALCNAGIRLDGGAFGKLVSPISLGIFFGLLFGKAIGITFFTFVTSKLKLTALPANVTYYDMFLVTILAGIGFTMSIFVTNLAFNDPDQIAIAKFSIIISSFSAGLAGFALNYFRSSKVPPNVLPG